MQPDLNFPINNVITGSSSYRAASSIFLEVFMEKNQKEIFRLRDNKITFRATNFEKDIIMRNYEESKEVTFQEFVIKVLSDGYIINIDTSELHQYANEVNKIGVNINQIAHKINMLDDKSPDLYLLKQDVSECLFLMNELTKIIRRHWMS